MFEDISKKIIKSVWFTVILTPFHCFHGVNCWSRTSTSISNATERDFPPIIWSVVLVSFLLVLVLPKRHIFHMSLIMPRKMIDTVPWGTCSVYHHSFKNTNTESRRLDRNSRRCFVWTPLHRMRLLKTETKWLKWALEKASGNTEHKRKKYSAKMLVHSKNALSSSLLIFFFRQHRMSWSWLFFKNNISVKLCALSQWDIA